MYMYVYSNKFKVTPFSLSSIAGCYHTHTHIIINLVDTSPSSTVQYLEKHGGMCQFQKDAGQRIHCSEY